MPYVYAIKHKASGYIYVGCTKGKLAKRMREHRCLLNQGRHSCPLMQVDWNRDGEDGFEMTPLESLPEDANVVLKRVRELYWMQVHAEKLYNQHQTSFAPQPWAIAKGVWSRTFNRKKKMRPKHRILPHQSTPKNTAVPTLSYHPELWVQALL